MSSLLHPWSDLLTISHNSQEQSGFVEVNNFEKRDTYFIFCYCCNKCFSGTMAFLCSMDVSMVWLPSNAIENLIVGIDYTNYCFSLLLLGLSVMLILLGKRALDMNREVIYFYFFLTVVWMFRACLASFIEPWPLQPIPAAAIGQLVASDALAIMMVVVSVCFIKELRRK